MSELHIVTDDEISPARERRGKMMIWGGFGLLVVTALVQTADQTGLLSLGLETWRPTLYAFCVFSTLLCWAQVVLYGEQGKRTLFVLPAALFVGALVIFPLIFGAGIAMSDWNLASPDGRKFNGFDNFWQAMEDPFYLNALWNMVLYTAAILVEYVIAFGLALLLNADIRARKFFRVAFLLPLMLSPVAVSWMIGKSMFEPRFGPMARLARELGWENPSFYGSPEIARLMMMMMDAWTYIPFMMIMLLAGLQAIPRELHEAAEVDGASPWRRFWEVTFPLMLPVSITAILIRVIFKLKLADIVINITSGGPGGATDTVTSFIFREYRDRSNVGYGTMLAFIYLVVIVVAMTVLIKVTARWSRPQT
ncbi:carbohydrate ABC transporter permease [Jannaschia seohaensis]|uniref:Multiple sugar transport system permease protein n=1 Tax=Jannaschia seohaensis TaxID=475081 RepID=A0A2Y9BVZ2_9RHOB|nr:sugar ABC transporter permease [Jannaschia seohaensis]PWJ21904.1 multiple sugar transport system permease protein [Jannaschia seohaensis]SSA38182.1 multiple sugar transport system permease protein [Jannaschia seohaensis]